MGDITITQDIIEGIVDIMVEVGWTIILRSNVYGAVDIENPGAAPSETIVNTPFEGFIFDIEDKYFNGTSILKGDRNLIVSIDGFTPEQIAAIAPGNYIVDSSDIYSIISAELINVSGLTATVIAQIRG